MNNYPLHPLCELLPEMDKKEFKALRHSIETEGQIVPIVIYDGMVLDGRNRQKVCLELGIEPIYEQYAGRDPIQFVTAANFERKKKASAGQRAAFVVLAGDWSEHAAGPGGDSRHSATWRSGKSTQPERAKQYGVSLRNLQNAERLWQDDHEELLRAVAHATMSLPDALKIAYPPKPKPERESHDDSVLGEDPEEVMEALRGEVLTLREQNEALRMERDRLAAEKLALVEGMAEGERKTFTLLEKQLEAARVRNNHLEEERNNRISEMQSRRSKRGQRPLNG